MTTLHWSRHEDGREWARTFSATLAAPCVMLLSGEMGSGKTQVVKWLLEALQVHDVVSPTYALHQNYGGGRFDHVDLYRLESDRDLASSGFWDLLQLPDPLLFVEWADRLPENVWPLAWTRIFVLLKKGHLEFSRVVELRVVKPQSSSAIAARTSE